MRSKRARLTSRQNPLVARFRAVARGDDQGHMLLDGAHLLREAAQARMPLEAVIALEPDPPLADLLDALERHGAAITIGSAAVLAAVSPVRSASAVCAIAKRPVIDPVRLYARDPLVVIACDVQDPGNLGAVVRVAEAAGASGVVAAGAAADPFGWKALRGSMGSALRLPVVRTANPTSAARTAREHGCRLLATVPRDGESLFSAAMTGATAVLIGGEGPGLPPELVALCDARVTIPMAAPVESLNAAVAAALLVYEARRQRIMASSPRQAGAR